MIEITHQQAQRLIRESLDRPVAEPQWNALEAHLETCPACRAYRDRRLGLVRGLARLFHERWWTVMLDGRVFPGQMAALSTLHARRTRQARSTLLALILLIAGAFGLLAWRANRPQPLSQPAAVLDPVVAAQPSSAAQPSATPLPGVGQPGSFAWQVVVEAADPAERDNQEIYLLSPGPDGTELTNLTRHPAADYAPVWSPDGQWIAFLSNRDNPQRSEIYLMSIAGTRLTRLTADANLRWQAPLTWSADGRYLAAAGFSTVTPRGAVYLLPLDGSGRIRPAPGSLGGGSPSFSPVTQRLAFATRSSTGRHEIFIHDLERGMTDAVYSSGELLNEGMGRGMNWSADGRAVAYVAYGPVDLSSAAQPGATWHARTTFYAADFDLAAPYAVMSSAVFTTSPGRELAAAAYAPNGDLYYQVENGGGRGCAALEYFPGNDSLAGTAPAPPSLPRLCIDAPIEQASWSQDGQWLVAAGREETGASPGIYALRIPGALARPRTVAVMRLADLPQGAGTPRVRPDRDLAALIDPRPAEPAAPGHEAPPNLLDRVLVSRSYDDRRGYVRTIPSLTAAEPAAAELPAAAPQANGVAERLGRCPRRSPEGDRLAYVASSSNFGNGAEAIFVEDLETGRARQVSSFEGLPAEAFWGETRVMGGFNRCPEWSPDGEKLATYVSTDRGAYLAVFSARADSPAAHFFAMDGYDMSIPPRWTAGSARVAVVRSPRDGQPARIVTIYPDTGAEVEIIASDGWNRVEDMAYAPDGRWLAYLAQTFGEDGLAQSELRVVRAAGREDLIAAPLPAHRTSVFFSGYTDLTWLSGGRPGWSGKLGLTFRAHQVGGQQSALMVYDLSTLKLSVLAVLEEDLRAAAWSPDGSWVVYSVPSGMWALNVPAALEGQAAPTWLGIEAVDDINWR